MSRFEKLLKRFLSRPKDFSYDELRMLLSGLGSYQLVELECALRSQGMIP